jgi:hypothetical protein
LLDFIVFMISCRWTVKHGASVDLRQIGVGLPREFGQDLELGDSLVVVRTRLRDHPNYEPIMT